MSHSSTVRDAVTTDASRLAVLATQVWLHTYATDGVSPDIAKYVLSQLTPEMFSSTLADPTVKVLVAEFGDNLVGFAVVKVGVPCESSDLSSTELQTLYVQEHFIGQGVGRSLLKACEAHARVTAGTPLWLTVNARNANAISFYGRQGYERVGTAYFVLGEGRHENHVMLGQLSAGI